MEWLFVMTLMYVAVYANGAHDTATPSRLVHLEQGPVRGYKAPDGDFYVFYGVPYATAPTGRDRFKAPLPPPVWSHTLEAIDNGIICPQKDYMGVIPTNKKMQEDCLIATVYAPDTLEDNIPVVVYIHGGGYVIAFGDLVTPRNLAKTKRVIVITFNYRLGAHGFLCLGTKEVPGNAGMKDQVELLRWVKKNIASFGGNPEDVTLAGYSAGSAAVDTLMISKVTNGLFNKVIPESGVSLATYNIQLDPIENARRYARWLNFSDIDDFYALQEFYLTAPYEVLTFVNSLISLDSTFIFTPCIERDVGDERILEDSPINIISSGNYQKVPILYGFSTMEGLLRIPLFEIWKNQMHRKFSDFLPGDLIFDSEEEKEVVATKVKEFYFGNKVSPESILGYVDYFSDVLVMYSTLRSVKLHKEAGNNKIYLYEYIYVDEHTIKIPYTQVRGPDHCAQTWAVLDGLNLTHKNEHLISGDLRLMKNVTRELWLNFMITGNPTPESSPFPKWPRTGANAIPHMALDRKLEVRDYFERNVEKRYRLWDKLYEKYYRMPIRPQPPLRLTSGSNTQHMILWTVLVIASIKILRFHRYI